MVSTFVIQKSIVVSKRTKPIINHKLNIGWENKLPEMMLDISIKRINVKYKNYILKVLDKN